MRIIGGKFKGRPINAPKNLSARPTTDFAKTGLFNILTNKIDFEGIAVLDLFCGTGNITLEFASRDANSVICVDADHKCLAFIKSESQKLGMKGVYPLKANVFSFIKKCESSFDLIFADPPYNTPETKEIPQVIFERKLLKENGLLIVEHGERESFASLEHFVEVRNYGNVHFSFFRQAHINQ